MCACEGDKIPKYQKRISGPLLDRIDIHIEAPRVDYEKLSSDCVMESSESIRARVQAARDIQQKRFSNNGSSDIVCNANLCVGEVRQFCKLQDEGQSLMQAAMTQLNLSARAYHRILKLARTTVDLAGSDESNLSNLRRRCALRGRPKLMLG
jgi:magnesium chelatase family protein